MHAADMKTNLIKSLCAYSFLSPCFSEFLLIQHKNAAPHGLTLLLKGSIFFMPLHWDRQNQYNVYKLK